MSEDGGTIPGLVDLRVDAVYEGARSGTFNDDPLSDLLGEKNKGGFRFRGPVGPSYRPRIGCFMTINHRFALLSPPGRQPNAPATQSQNPFISKPKNRRNPATQTLDLRAQKHRYPHKFVTPASVAFASNIRDLRHSGAKRVDPCP